MVVKSEAVTRKANARNQAARRAASGTAAASERMQPAADRAPQLFGRYKTLMRYKALAKCLRQAAGIADPVPVSVVFDGPPAPPPGRGDASGAGGGDVPAGRAERGWRDARDARDYYAVESHLSAARRLLEGCGNTCAALFRAVDAALEGEIALDYQEFWIIRNLKTLRMATFPHPQCLRA